MNIILFIYLHLNLSSANMSYLFNLCEQTSTLRSVLSRPIELSENETYVIGFLNFTSYNMIPNVDLTNNKLHIGQHEITIPVGTYEIEDIETYLKHKLAELYKATQDNPNITVPFLSIKVNINILKCEIKSILDIDFKKPNSVGQILGFGKRKLKANKKHISDNLINITKTHTICVNCNLVTNSYKNGVPVHILYAFNLKVNPGFKIEESPLNVIYLPINTKYISEIIVQITDQDGNLINFNNQLITVGLHLKKYT